MSKWYDYGKDGNLKKYTVYYLETTFDVRRKLNYE